MTGTYIDLEAGIPTQKNANDTSAGASDAGKIVKLDSEGRLNLNMMPSGIAPDTKDLTASEALSAGNMINIYNDAGTGKARKADATAANKFHTVGFVLDSVSSGQPAKVYFEGVVTGLSGLTIGAKYYLSATAGAITTTAPSSSGALVQFVGTAISATELSFEPHQHYILA